MKLGTCVAISLSALAMAACAPQAKDAPSPISVAIDAPAQILETLSQDSMGGRLTGSAGNAAAREYILDQLDKRNAKPFSTDFIHAFDFTRRDGKEFSGLNIITKVDGADDTLGTIVLTAHYDHVGIQKGEIYNGADDNASGVAGLFAIYDAFAKAPPQHNLVFAFLDAEEMGLQGARAFVKDELVAIDEISANLNFDMISRSDKSELYAVGTYHYPQLTPIIDAVAADSPIKLLKGHDSPDLGPRDDWTMLSDHAAFHASGVPFVYFGVEDHADYHQPGDDFEKIDAEFLEDSFQTVVMAAQEMDKVLK